MGGRERGRLGGMVEVSVVVLFIAFGWEGREGGGK